MPFVTQWKIRFADVDPAGIVFYPRYFEMLNGVVEDWFEAMGHSFSKMHLQMHRGVPTVRIECDFLKPSELGDHVEISVTPTQVGRSSCSIQYLLICNGEVRLKVAAILVYMDLQTQKSCSWPDDLREKLLEMQNEVSIAC
jgi:4-hydroxybenzoyl-CoA thioesterase